MPFQICLLASVKHKGKVWKNLHAGLLPTSHIKYYTQNYNKSSSYNVSLYLQGKAFKREIFISALQS